MNANVNGSNWLGWFSTVQRPRDERNVLNLRDQAARAEPGVTTTRPPAPAAPDEDVLDETPGADIGIIAYGSTDAPMAEARAMLANRGVKTSYLRLRALPLTEDYARFAEKYPRVYVIENNFDGQMARVLMAEEPKLAPKLISIAHNDGLPLTGRWIAQAIVEQER